MSRQNLKLYKLLASWFGAGYSPKMPGTVGSLAALPYAIVIYALFGSFGLLFSALIITVFGVYICDQLIKNDPSIKDPGWIVIDEVAGIWIALAFVPFTVVAWSAAFIMFRVLDIKKPYPVSIPDTQMTGGKGIMLDDVLAGAITAVVLGIVFWIL